MQNSQFKKIKKIIINCFHVSSITFTFMHLSDVFIQSDLQLHSGYTFSLVCVPWESSPQPFALLTQCSTTEPHRILQNGIWCHLGLFFLHLMTVYLVKWQYTIYLVYQNPLFTIKCTDDNYHNKGGTIESHLINQVNHKLPVQT